MVALLEPLYHVLESDVDAEMEESGSSPEEEDSSGSGTDSASHLSHRQQSFYDAPEFDYGLSFDIFSRPPVEVVTRRLHAGHEGDATVRYPLQRGASSQLQASVHLPLFLLVTVLLYHHYSVIINYSRHFVVAAATTFVSHCFHTC